MPEQFEVGDWIKCDCQGSGRKTCTVKGIIVAKADGAYDVHAQDETSSWGRETIQVESALAYQVNDATKIDHMKWLTLTRGEA